MTRKKKLQRNLITRRKDRANQGLDLTAIQLWLYIYNYHDPLEIAGQIFDNRWRNVQFVESAIGVPIGPSWYVAQYRACHVVGYSAAQALRWWLHAVADAMPTMRGLCLETKIVTHEIKYNYECVAVSESEVVSEGLLSHMKPEPNP